MKVSGLMVRQMDKASFGMLMATDMKVIGNEIRQMALVFISMQMVLSILVNGSMIFNKDLVKRPGWMDHHMKVIILMVKSKARVLMYGLMVHLIQVVGKTIKLMA